MDSATTMPKNKFIDSGKGKKPVPDDLEAVSRKIEYWDQGLIARYRINYRTAQGTEHSIEWDGTTARVSEQHSPE
jgi:hypothetical protein